MRQHHKMGFSRWGRAMRCPGSVKASELHQQPETDGRGTRMHAFNETGHKGTLSAFEVSQVRKYQWRIDELLGAVLESTGGKFHKQTRQKEPRLELAVGDETIFGYADDLIFFGDNEDPRGAIIADLKTHPTGVYDVWDAEWQLKGLALALLQMWPQIAAVVCLTYCPAGQETEVIVRRGDVEAIMEPVKRMMEAIGGDEPSLRPGPACRYCPAAGACPQSLDYSLTVGDETAGIYRVVGERAEVLDGRAFALRLARVKAAEKILAAEKKRMTDVAIAAIGDGYENKHLGLTAGRKRPKITDYSRARDVVPREIMAVLDRKLENKWSFANLRDAAEEAFPDKNKKALRERLEELLDGILTYSVDSPSVQIKEVDDVA